MTYTAPISDMRFAATRLAGFPEIAHLPGGEELSESLLDSIFEQGGRFALGWNAVPFDHEYGGQGVPWLVAMALQEIGQHGKRYGYDH